MFFHHEIKNDDLLREMENSGYDSLTPAITPEDLRALCEVDPILLSCYEQMTSYCVRYAHDVFNMMQEQAVLSEARKEGKDTQDMYEELQRIDGARHSLHEAMMDSVNLVSRELAKRGLNNDWMREVSSGGRASYAKFAMLTFYKLYSKMNSPSTQEPS